MRDIFLCDRHGISFCGRKRAKERRGHRLWEDKLCQMKHKMEYENEVIEMIFKAIYALEIFILIIITWIQNR